MKNNHTLRIRNDSVNQLAVLERLLLDDESDDEQSSNRPQYNLRLSEARESLVVLLSHFVV